MLHVSLGHWPLTHTESLGFHREGPGLGLVGVRTLQTAEALGGGPKNSTHWGREG